jgi:hypothetical protein
MWSTHFGILHPKSSPTSTPEVLIPNSIHRRISNASLPTPPMFMLASLHIVRDSSVVRRHYISLLEPSNVGAQYIRKTADLLLQLWVSTFPRFVAIGFYFLSETLI